MSKTEYSTLLTEIFNSFPSVQSGGFSSSAYKPGLDNMEAFDNLLERPSEAFRAIHVAGTNGKGSVSSMLAAALSAEGLKVGLYTSPHILDFRERARIVSDGSFSLVPKDYVASFLTDYKADFDRLNLSFFEITTGLAFKWFADEEVDVAVVEVGLGGRLDSTNIIVPELSVVTSIGLDHCAQLGDTRALIAGEKAGIFKGGVPAVVGAYDNETGPVFESAASSVHCPLFFADDFEVPEDLAAKLDLKGPCQAYNLRTALCALDILGIEPSYEALASTAAVTGFRGRWEKIGSAPDVICDIGHNPPALKINFKRLSELVTEGVYDGLVIVYGVMVDKALGDIISLMPSGAQYIFTTPSTPRALQASRILESFRAAGRTDPAEVVDLVRDALARARAIASDKTLIYVGGSTFVVSEVF